MLLRKRGINFMAQIVEEFLEAWCKAKRGTYVRNNTSIKINGSEEEIFIKIENISIRENQITTTYTKNELIKKQTISGNDKFLWLGGFTNTDKSKCKNINIGDYIFSIEPMDSNYADDDQASYDITKLVANADNYFANNPDYGIYSCVLDGSKYNKFKAVLIKIKDQDNNYVYNFFDSYVMSTDNRTYSKTIRNLTRIESVQKKENQEIESKYPYNMLVYGAPGTGKSHWLDELVENEVNDKFVLRKDENQQIEEALPRDLDVVAEFKRQFVKRITFYEDYSYENFVGCYKAKPKYASRNVNLAYDGKNIEGEVSESKVSYEFEAGPFVELYVKAKNDPNPNNKYYLFIEEINRAKAASVFGDMFQLLDRKNGVSKYDITPEPALREYLYEHLDEYKNSEIPVSDVTMRLPNNLYLWATMNSADQGVFSLDSAFKRRWEFRYKDIVGFDRCANICLIHDDNPRYINWDVFRTAINNKILEYGLDEDRCIGAYYFSDDELNKIEEYTKEGDKEKKRDMANPLVDKLLAYLKQDVFRMDDAAIFNTSDGKKCNMSSLRTRVLQDENIVNILNIDIDNVAVDKESKEWKDTNDSKKDRDALEDTAKNATTDIDDKKEEDNE